MTFLTHCRVCNKFRLFTKRWRYYHFVAGWIYDKEENPKCYPCYKELKSAIDRMAPV